MPRRPIGVSAPATESRARPNRFIGVLALVIWLFAAVAVLGVLAMVARLDVWLPLLAIACAGAAAAFVAMGVFTLLDVSAPAGEPTRTSTNPAVDASIEARRQVSWMLEDASEDLREVARGAVHDIRRQIQASLHEARAHDSDAAIRALRHDLGLLEHRLNALAQFVGAVPQQPRAAVQSPPAPPLAYGGRAASAALPNAREAAAAPAGADPAAGRTELAEGVTIIQRR
jgi:hypothetical protein